MTPMTPSTNRVSVEENIPDGVSRHTTPLDIRRKASSNAVGMGRLRDRSIYS